MFALPHRRLLLQKMVAIGGKVDIPTGASNIDLRFSASIMVKDAIRAMVPDSHSRTSTGLTRIHPTIGIGLWR
jgi:hypothetical protein